MAPVDDAEVMQLEARAAALTSLIPNARRAFIIEFAGTPKSGKSTSVEAIRHFFSRNGFRVHVLAERAAVCPIPMKGHLFFNSWCAASMLAELLENVEADADIVIVDRGIFDALVWLGSQRRRGEVTEAEAHAIEAFLLLDRWTKLIDLPVVMTVSPEQALARETSQRITSKPGSIMNEEVLSAITRSVNDSAKRYRAKFPSLIEVDTSNGEVRQTNVTLAHNILDHLQDFLNPRILAIPRAEIEALPLEGGGAFTPQALDSTITCIEKHGRFVRRAEAEENPGLVQIVSCGVLTESGKVFLFERKEADPKSQLYGSTTVWQGKHVEERVELFGRELLIETVRERIMNSLFLSRKFPVQLKGYCWDRDHEKSSRHFGVIAQVTIDNPHTATDLRQKEFRHGRGHGLAGKFATWDDVERESEAIRLESWSTAILRNLSDFRDAESVS